MKIKSSYTCILLVSFLSFISTTRAQNLVDLVPDVSPAERADFGRAFGSYASATTVFTGRDAVSTGNFSFDHDGGDFQVTNIPLTHTFGNKGDSFRPSIRGALGHFESRSSSTTFSDLYKTIENDLGPDFQGLENRSDFRRDSATSLSVGGSLLFESCSGLIVEPAFDLTWTHVRRQFDYHNPISALIGLKYDRELFNNSTEAITYAPSLNIRYTVPLSDEFSITPSMEYKHLFTSDLWSKSPYADFSIDAGVFIAQLKGHLPLSAANTETPLALEPVLKLTNLYGAARSSIGTNNLWDVGLNLVMELGEKSFFSEVHAGIAFVRGDDLTGYRLAIGTDF